MSIHVLADGTKCYRWPTCRIHTDVVIAQLPADSALRPQLLNLEGELSRAYCEHAVVDAANMTAAKPYALLRAVGISPICPTHNVHHVYNFEAVARTTSNASSYLRTEVQAMPATPVSEALAAHIKDIRKETAAAQEQNYRALAQLKNKMTDAELKVAQENKGLQSRGVAFAFKPLPVSRAEQLDASPEELHAFYVCGRKLAYDSRQAAQQNADRVFAEKQLRLTPYSCEHCGKFHMGKPSQGIHQSNTDMRNTYLKSWATNRVKADAWVKVYRASRGSGSPS